MHCVECAGSESPSVPTVSQHLESLSEEARAAMPPKHLEALQADMRDLDPQTDYVWRVPPWWHPGQRRGQLDTTSVLTEEALESHDTERLSERPIEVQPVPKVLVKWSSAAAGTSTIPIPGAEEEDGARTKEIEEEFRLKRRRMDENESWQGKALSWANNERSLSINVEDNNNERSLSINVRCKGGCSRCKGCTRCRLNDGCWGGCKRCVRCVLCREGDELHRLTSC